MNIIDTCLDKINFKDVYQRVLVFVPDEFGIAIDKFSEKCEISDEMRNPMNHITQSEDGPITIVDTNYRASSVFFDTLELATKNCIRQDAGHYIKNIYSTNEYLRANMRERKMLDMEFLTKFTVMLYKQYSHLRHQELAKNGELGQKPKKPIYESKEEYIKKCIGTSIVKVYMDDCKLLNYNNDKML